MPALNVPGAALATLTTPSNASATGAALLDLRFAAILSQCKVKQEHMDAIGNAGCDTSQLFGSLGGKQTEAETKFLLFVKRTCNLDQETRGEDAIPTERNS